MNDSLSQSQSQSQNRTRVRYPAPCGHFPHEMRVRGHSLSLASDIGALEECLLLERSSATPGDNPEEGIHSPPAVPFCDFLMLRDPLGTLQAVARLMRLGGDTPVRNPLESGRFHLSPLLTALRYSREGILEMGSPAVAPVWDPPKAAHLIWAGCLEFVWVASRDMLETREYGDWPGRT